MAFPDCGVSPCSPNRHGAPQELTDTSPRMVKCRFFSLSITASPSGGEKVGEQLHSTERRETSRCCMALEWGQATRAGCSTSGPAAAEGLQTAPELEAAEQRQGRGEPQQGGWHGELRTSSTSHAGQGQHPQVMGQDLEMGEILPEAKNIWFKWVRGTGAAGWQSPLSVQDEGVANKWHPEFCLGAGQWFGLVQTVRVVARLSSSMQP